MKRLLLMALAGLGLSTALPAQGSSPTLSSKAAEAQAGSGLRDRVATPVAGPGLGNLTHAPAQLFQPASILHSPLGHGRPAMVKGWLMMIYKSDGGGAPNDGGIEFWDVSDPFAPTLVRQYDDARTHGLREAHGYAFARVKNRDYAALQSLQGVQFWDVTDPMQLELAGESNLPGINGGDYEGVWWIAWQPPYVFAAGRSNGLFILDASDPVAPVLVRQVPTGSLGGLGPGMVYALGNLMVLGQPQTGELATLDISDPLNPFLLDRVSLQPGYSHLFAGGRIFTSGGDGGPNQLHVHTVSAAGLITNVGSVGTGLGNGGYASWQDGFVHSGFSDQYAKFRAASLTQIGTGSSGLPGRDEDFAQVLGNLVLVADDHGQGSALIVHSIDPDLTGPEVDAVQPPDGALDQALTTRVGVSMSDQIDPDSVVHASFHLRGPDGQALAGWTSVQLGLVNFTPTLPLAPNTTYTVEVSGLRDVAGNTGGAFSSSFTTGEAPVAPTGAIQNLVAGSGIAYQTGSFQTGALAYVDRDYTYNSSHPAEFEGQPYVLTANDDKAQSATSFLTFDLADESTVHVLYDDRATQLPAWLAGWSATGASVQVQVLGQPAGYLDFERVWAAGPVTLGGNLQAPAAGASSNYTVVVVPRSAPVLALDPLAPTQLGDPTDFSAVATGHGPVTYVWDFGDGTPPTAPSSSPVASHVYAAPGRYTVMVGAANPFGAQNVSAVQIVHTAPTPAKPTRSGPIALAGGRCFNVNPDHDTVTAIDVASAGVLWEQPVGAHPRTLAVAPGGALWVTNQGDATISILDPQTGAPLGLIALPRASAPYGLAFAPDGGACYVTLEATGQLVRLSLAGSLEASLSLGAAARGLAVSADSQALFVTRFVSPATHGEVWRVDAATLTLDTTLVLAYDPGPDTENSGRGVPNYLTALAISPDGTRARVPSKKDNTARGLFRDGQELTFESRTRTILSELDLSSNSEVAGARRDLNDRSMAQAAAWSPLGDLVLVATQATNTIEVLDAQTGLTLASLPTGAAPQGLVFDDAGTRLFVHDFMDRQVSIFDTAALVAATSNAAPRLSAVSTVAVEALAPDVLLGKRLFFDAADPRIGLDGYISCAGCHLDGGSDGQVWDFTQSGEGLRNTIDLFGRAGTGHGNVHWTANFDEIQDFENELRESFAGTGLMEDPDFAATALPLGPAKAGLSPDLDALASYVESLSSFPPSPHRDPSGNLTPAGVSGAALFGQLGCATCHPPPAYTDLVQHDVGTLLPSSGAGSPAIDTPTLRALWSSGPYLHDGREATLGGVLNSASHGGTATLDPADRADLAAFLLQIE